VEHFAQFKHKMIIKDGDAQKHSRTNKNVFWYEALINHHLNKTK
jgi:hypothetical protein